MRGCHKRFLNIYPRVDDNYFQAQEICRSFRKSCSGHPSNSILLCIIFLCENDSFRRLDDNYTRFTDLHFDIYIRTLHLFSDSFRVDDNYRRVEHNYLSYVRLCLVEHDNYRRLEDNSLQEEQDFVFILL